MPITTVAILSPGDMGHAVGRSLGEHGIDVITCLRGRSDRTRDLASKAGIRDVPTLEDMVAAADLVLSILVPADAVEVARQVAEAMRTTGEDTALADCNAVSPQNAAVMEANITAAGGRFVDASIIGGPPTAGYAPNVYVSGAHAGIMSELDGMGINVVHLGDQIGRASGIKMCYGALTKGTFALHAALLTAAEAMGLSAELGAELRHSQDDAYRRMQAQLPRLPAKAFRWIGEMDEIASTFDHLGVTPYFHQGAAEMYRLMSETPFARETAETVDQDRDLEQTIAAMVRLLT